MGYELGLNNEFLGFVPWVLAITGIIMVILSFTGYFDEPITYSCNINGQVFPLEYDTCEKIYNAVEGRFYVSVMMTPHFVYGCDLSKEKLLEAKQDA